MKFKWARVDGLKGRLPWARVLHYVRDRPNAEHWQGEMKAMEKVVRKLRGAGYRDVLDIPKEGGQYRIPRLSREGERGVEVLERLVTHLVSPRRQVGWVGEWQEVGQQMEVRSEKWTGIRQYEKVVELIRTMGGFCVGGKREFVSYLPECFEEEDERWVDIVERMWEKGADSWEEVKDICWDVMVRGNEEESRLRVKLETSPHIKRSNGRLLVKKVLGAKAYPTRDTVVFKCEMNGPTGREGRE